MSKLDENLDFINEVMKRYRPKAKELKKDSPVEQMVYFDYFSNTTWSIDRDRAMELLYEEIIMNLDELKYLRKLKTPKTTFWGCVKTLLRRKK